MVIILHPVLQSAINARDRRAVSSVELDVLDGMTQRSTTPVANGDGTVDLDHGNGVHEVEGVRSVFSQFVLFFGGGVRVGSGVEGGIRVRRCGEEKKRKKYPINQDVHGQAIESSW